MKLKVLAQTWKTKMTIDSNIEIKCHTCQNRAPILFSNWDKKKEAYFPFLSSKGCILCINSHLFNLRLVVAFNRLRSNKVLKNVPFPVVNFNNLVF